jgi:hypothetical protein
MKGTSAMISLGKEVLKYAGTVSVYTGKFQRQPDTSGRVQSSEGKR